MPIGILKFNLPEEAVDYQHAVMSGGMVAAMHELDEYLRRVNKHGNEDFNEAVKKLKKEGLTAEQAAAQVIRSTLFQYMQDYCPGLEY